ncbi:MAG: 2-hydroxyacyl-CoA dehydratase, partial [Dehalococcoidia bacterium]
LNCSFTRSCLQFVLDGRYDFLDGIVLTDSCDHIRRLYDLFRVTRDIPFLHFMSVPHKITEYSIGLYREDLGTFRESVEKAFGVKITDASLRNAIEVYNETRNLLQRIYDLRKSDTPPLTGAETLDIVLASTIMPREQYNDLLRQLIEELHGRQGITDYKARLMVAGSGGCDDPDYYRVIEGLGGLVVTDALCFGARYFWKPVELTDDPLSDLATAYQNRPACAKMADQVVERIDFIKKMAKDFNVDGVVYHRLRYCDLWAGQLLLLRDQLNKSDMPMLELEREYTLGATGQLRTRLQAFLESLGG